MYRNVESLRGLHQKRSVPNLQSPLCKHHILLLWDWELSHARRSFSHCAIGILAEIPYLQLLNLDVQRVWSGSEVVVTLSDALACMEATASTKRLSTIAGITKLWDMRWTYGAGSKTLRRKWRLKNAAGRMWMTSSQICTSIRYNQLSLDTSFNANILALPLDMLIKHPDPRMKRGIGPLSAGTWGLEKFRDDMACNTSWSWSLGTKNAWYLIEVDEFHWHLFWKNAKCLWGFSTFLQTNNDKLWKWPMKDFPKMHIPNANIYIYVYMSIYT